MGHLPAAVWFASAEQVGGLVSAAGRLAAAQNFVVAFLLAAVAAQDAAESQVWVVRAAALDAVASFLLVLVAVQGAAESFLAALAAAIAAVCSVPARSMTVSN